MDNDSKYQIGYRKPPRRTQFRPGRSGNASGRPKKAKTLSEVLMKELRAPVIIVEHSKRKRITKLEAMLRQHINKAAGGDAKSMALILNLSKVQGPDRGDNVRALVQEFRTNNALREAADRNRLPTDTNESTEPTNSGSQDLSKSAGSEVSSRIARSDMTAAQKSTEAEDNTQEKPTTVCSALQKEDQDDQL